MYDVILLWCSLGLQVFLDNSREGSLMLQNVKHVKWGLGMSLEILKMSLTMPMASSSSMESPTHMLTIQQPGAPLPNRALGIADMLNKNS